MNKKDYINAQNEIKIDTKLKNKLKQKIINKKSTNSKLKYVLTTSLIVLLLITIISIPKSIHEPDIIASSKVSNLESINSFENLHSILKENNSRYGSDNNHIYREDMLESSTDSTLDIVPNSFSDSNSDVSKSESDHSSTNIQVEGVDEADIVKTDGNYIYYAINSKIVIADVRDNSNIQIVSSIDLKSIRSSKEMYLKDDKLVVIYGKYDNSKSSYFTYTNLYNISDPNRPKLEREVVIEGNYLSSRMINNDVYVLSNESVHFYIDDIEAYENNKEEITPEYKDSIYSNEMKCITYDRMYCMPDNRDNSYLTIGSFNITNDDKANIDTYLGAGENIYMSQDNLYVLSTRYEHLDSPMPLVRELVDSVLFSPTNSSTTYISKFNLKDGIANFQTDVSVKGEILNQFSVDEYNGYLRVAITEDGEVSTNNLYTFDNNLNPCGSIKDLALGEKIYSVRFMGKKAYVVTFVEIDPLFVLDLANPYNPKVLGELKIPGYITYMHPYDENHIIGFGYDTEVSNYGNVSNTSFKMALFDVTDPTNPKELFTEKLGGKGTSSELLNNHKALLFSKEKDLLAFPIRIKENYSEKFEGAVVYGLTLENGFTKKGDITHENYSPSSSYRYNYCDKIDRIIYINDDLYTLSLGMIKSTNMYDLKENSFIKIK